MNQASAGAGQLIWLIAGFLAWSLAFVALYAALSVGCRFGWNQVDLLGGLSLQRAMLAALFIGACVLCAWVVQATRQRRRALACDASPAARLLAGAAVLSALAALAATIVTLSPALLLTACV